MRTRRQRLGQHFLRDRRVAEAMAAALAAEPPRVLEIGPGEGALTAPLVARFPRVLAVEVDPALAGGLAARLGHPAGLEVWCGDALRVDPQALARDGPWQVAGNLPYAVATPLVRRLLRCHPAVVRLVVMVQREVAERLLAPPGHSSRGLLSLELEAFGRARRLLQVPPGAFAPPPRVVSTVLVVDLRTPEQPEELVERAFSLAGAAFARRRKMLTNALAGVAPPPRVQEALALAGCGPAARPQEVTWTQWLALAQALPAGHGG